MGRSKNKKKIVPNANKSENQADGDQNETSALTNKPVNLSPGGQANMVAKLKGSDFVEEPSVLEKTYINGDKAILSTIDEKGKVLSVDPEDLKPVVVGNGLIPKVLKTDTVYSMSGYTPKSSLLNDMNLVLSAPVETLLKFPKLRFKNINDIPIWSKYQVFLNRTVKMMYDYKIPISHSDYGSFVTMQAKMTENLFKLIDMYDVVWKDFRPETDYSILNGKRIMKNLSLSPEHISDPMSLVREIQGQSYSYDEILDPYFKENIPVKDDKHNVRRRNTFKIDAESMFYLQRLTRPATRLTTNGVENVQRFMGISHEFKVGYPSDEELSNFFNDTMTIQHYIVDRAGELINNSTIESRSIYRNLDLHDGRLDRVKDIVSKYDVVFDKVNVFSGVLRNTFLASIEMSASTLNSLSAYYANTEFGISALRRTAKTAIISSLSSASVPGFINSILRLYFDSNVRLTFQLNAEFAVNWTFNATLFIALFKPQVCSRQNVMAMIQLMVNNFCKIHLVPYTSVTESLAKLAFYLSGDLTRTISEWWDYSQSRYDPDADYNALYTNYGNNVLRGKISDGYVTSTNNLTGYQFWGKPALSPWRAVVMTSDDGGFANYLVRMLEVVKTQWSTVWTEFLACVINDHEYGFITNLYRFVSTLDLFACSELNMNRFKNEFKTEELEIDNRSVLSFAMYARMTDVPYYQSNVAVFKLFFLSLDYYLSEAAMLYQCFTRIEQVLMNVAGLSIYSQTFFKEYDMLNLVGNYCNHEVVKSIFSELNFGNLSRLSMTVGRSQLNQKSLMEHLTDVYYNDMSQNTNSRWFIHMQALDIVTNQAEWRKFGLEDSFTVGPVELGSSFNDLFKTKIKSTTLDTYINYRQNYMKFGSFSYQKALQKKSLTETIGFRIPTFVNYKIVSKLLDGSEFKASTGETSPFEWMYKVKDPVTSDNFRIDSVEITREIVIQWERDYQYEVLFHDLRTALAGSQSLLFINESLRNDIMLIIRAQDVTEDLYLDDFNDITVEFSKVFENEFSKSMNFGQRYRTFLSIV